MKKPIVFGVIVKDKVTGFQGTVTAQAEYITGCTQFLVQPPANGADFKEGRWFDEGRLEQVGDSNLRKGCVNSNENGSDIPAPIK